MNSSDICAQNGDDLWGPQVEPCLRAFDFTLQFESIILSITPSVVFLLIAPMRLWMLRKVQKRLVGGGTLQITKLVRQSLLTSIEVSPNFPIACHCAVWHLADIFTGPLVSRYHRKITCDHFRSCTLTA